jgi:hypothetical protein
MTYRGVGDMAAAYGVQTLATHPIADGNKRADISNCARLYSALPQLPACPLTGSVAGEGVAGEGKGEGSDPSYANLGFLFRSLHSR